MAGADPKIHLREVHDEDIPLFFEHQRDAKARHLAAFTSADPDDREAYDEHWARIRADDAIWIRTIELDSAVDGHGVVVGHIASFFRGEDREVAGEEPEPRFG